MSTSRVKKTRRANNWPNRDQGVKNDHRGDRWYDDNKRNAGVKLIEIAQDREKWQIRTEAYTQRVEIGSE